MNIPISRNTPLIVLLTFSLAVWSTASVCAAEPTIAFENHVKPIFEKHCYSCHGSKRQEGGLRLDARTPALRGGDNYAPAIKPGSTTDSPLFQFISRTDADLQMPPEGDRLTSQEIETLRLWIEQGATWPDDQAESDPWKDHWAFQPLRRPSLPVPVNSSSAINPIDRFVFQKLDQLGLQPSPSADRQTLIRRLYFDLVGLPPPAEEVSEFMNDPDPLAYEKLVDRLLASPHYGERWARHWLDIVRFAESHGFEMNQARPNAWPYRDYVIAAFNSDKPYDQFVREQLAGDACGQGVATSFLVGGPWDQVKSPDPGLTAQQRADELNDMVSTTGSVFLGLTVGCARCHSHKFDPVSHTDYHALKACFEGVMHGEREVGLEKQEDEESRRRRVEQLRRQLADLESQPQPAPINPRVNVERFAPVAARKVRFTVRRTEDLEPCVDELEVWTAGPDSRNVALASTGAKATASSVYPNSKIHRLEHVNDGRYGNSFSWISKERGAGWVEIEFANRETIDRILWGRDRLQKFTDRLATDYVIEISDGGPWQQVASAADHNEAASRVAQRKLLEQQISDLISGPLAYAGQFTEPGPTKRFQRGDPLQPKETVLPGSPVWFGNVFQLPENSPEQSRRIALANWITDVRNPLTARVIVNRLWQFHFGEGIVATPSDFGINGARPSHPELLDWLAVELIDGRNDQPWSLKHIHRLICTSATYRQSSTQPFSADGPSQDPRLVDAACRFLWQYPPRRLEAEILRDAILSASGSLDLRLGGPGFDLFEPNSNYVKVYTPKREFGPAEFRRMVYQSKPRMQLEDTFGAFDCPDAGQIAPRRNRSTTPLQALNLLNSPFIVQQSELFAERIAREAGSESSEQVARAFWIAFGRQPDSDELARSSELIEQHGLSALCRAILNANEFLYVR